MRILLAAGAYFLAAFLCFKVAKQSARPGVTWWKKPTDFWQGVGALMIALGINKQLDLQSWFTRVSRVLFRDMGLYERRREYQAVFVLVVAIVSVAMLATLLWGSRHKLRERGLAIMGAVYLVGLVVISASSFHKIDAMLYSSIGGLRWNWILELSGIGCVGLGAYLGSRSRPGTDLVLRNRPGHSSG